MKEKLKGAALALTAVAALGTGAAIANAGGGEDDGEGHGPITGSAYHRATQVALKRAGGGKVTETEAGDEESYYQVEVTREDDVMDVNLDRKFRVVKTKVERGDDD